LRNRGLFLPLCIAGNAERAGERCADILTEIEVNNPEGRVARALIFAVIACLQPLHPDNFKMLQQSRALKFDWLGNSENLIPVYS